MMRFSKMHGLGNDFMVVDATKQHFLANTQQIQAWADRHTGIGFDQLLLLEPNEDATHDFTYRIFNADGSEVNQCGNGARCIARFVNIKQLSDKTQLRFKTASSLLETELLDNGHVKVNMGIPELQPNKIPLKFEQQQNHYTLTNSDITFGAVSMGNPHAVIAVNDIAKAPLTTIGRNLSIDPLFPQQTNVGFMQIMHPQHIQLRVWERGAGETKACGSGACAAVVVGHLWQQLENHVLVTLPGGELRIDWQGKGQPLWMTGDAVFVFDGEIAV